MNDFYKRHLSPEFGDTSVATNATNRAAQLFADAVEKLKENQANNEETLRLATYRNLAQKTAAEAFRKNPTDMDAYLRQFRETMRQFPTPIGQQGRYGAIVETVESQYFGALQPKKSRRQRSR
jgi:hypothetical protein